MTERDLLPEDASELADDDTDAYPETSLLIHARRTITYPPTLTLEYPTGEMTEAISAAGFKQRRTLIWMRV